MLTVDSALSCSKNVWFRSKNARFCSKIFSRLMLEIARWSLEIFLRSKCSTIFRLEIARIENSKFKIVLEIARIEKFNARNARDRCFSRSVSTLIQTYFGFTKSAWLFIWVIKKYSEQLNTKSVLFEDWIFKQGKFLDLFYNNLFHKLHAEYVQTNYSCNSYHSKG